MKIAKTVFLVVCIGLFLFLLLPFLQTTPPADPSQLKTQPQVATGNPLTAIAQRLRALFGGKERTARRLSPASNAPVLPAEEFLAVSSPRFTTGQPAAVPPSGNPTSNPVVVDESPLDFGQAALQTDQGEWVLIRQTAPQSGQPGMHEVNVHDNPYDRYVKQERAARALPTPQKTEIPDSKWARLVRPVKQFFGLDTPTPVAPPALTLRQEDPHARSLTSAKDKRTAGSRYPSTGPMRLPWPDITPQEWSAMTPQERAQEQQRRSVAQFADLLSGTRAAEEAAEIMADSKYPNPKNKQEEQEKEQYKEQMTQQNLQQIKDGILQTMQQNAQDKEPVDELSYIMGCKNASLPSPACEADPAPYQPVASAAPGLIAQEAAKNAQLFYDKTRYVLPKDLPLTIVLGPTTPQAIANMVEVPNPSTQQAAEIYQFLYEQQQCASNTCYWVANSTQQDPQLTDAVSMTSAQLKPDPKNTYPGYKQAFVQHKLDQLPEEATAQQKAQARRAALAQFEQNAVHFVPYTPKQLKEVQDQTLAAANPNNKEGKPQDLTIFYVTDPAQASQFAHDIDSVIFGYGQTSLVNVSSSEQAAEHIIVSTAENVNDAQKVVSSLVTQPTVSAVTQEAINQQIRQQNQAGAGWEGIFNATKNWGNSPKPGAPKK